MWVGEGEGGEGGCNSVVLEYSQGVQRNQNLLKSPAI